MAFQNEVTDLFDAEIEPLPEIESQAGGAKIEKSQITPPPGSTTTARTTEQMDLDRIEKENAAEAAAGATPSTQQTSNPGSVVAPGGQSAAGEGVQTPPPVVGQQQPPAVPPAATPTPVHLDPTAFAEALRAAGFGQPQQQQQQIAPERQLTQEEIDQQLGVWKATDEWNKRLLDPDTQAAAIAEMQGATIRQAVLMSRHLEADLRQKAIQEALAPVMAQLEKAQPALQQAEQLRSEQVIKTFHARHPLLADPKLAPIIKQSYAAVRASGQQFATQEQAFDAIANTATEVIRAVKPDFGQPTAPVQQQQQQQQPPAVPPPTGGATGGGSGGGSSANATPKNEVAEIWG